MVGIANSDVLHWIRAVPLGYSKVYELTASILLPDRELRVTRNDDLAWQELLTVVADFNSQWSRFVLKKLRHALNSQIIYTINVSELSNFSTANTAILRSLATDISYRALRIHKD